MNIVPHIQELLLNHDCVIVPGFGGILANYFPARIDKGNSTLYPPRKILSFNKNLDNNDGLLIGKISKSLNITYPEAKQLVEEQVRITKQQLASGQTVIFNQIGSFINNSEGNLQFEPDMKFNYLLDTYGLEPVSINVEKYEMRKQTLYPTDKEPVRTPSARKYLWRAAVIVPLIVLMVAVPLKTSIFKNNVGTANMNPLATTELEINKKAIDEDNHIITPNITAETAVEVATTITPIESLPITGNSYNIITGSFKIRQNAELQAEMLRSEGFDSEIAEAPNGFFRVSAGKYQDMETATRQKTLLAKNYPNSWIKVQR